MPTCPTMPLASVHGARAPRNPVQHRVPYSAIHGAKSVRNPVQDRALDSAMHLCPVSTRRLRMRSLGAATVWMKCDPPVLACRTRRSTQRHSAFEHTCVRALESAIIGKPRQDAGALRSWSCDMPWKGSGVCSRGRCSMAGASCANLIAPWSQSSATESPYASRRCSSQARFWTSSRELLPPFELLSAPSDRKLILKHHNAIRLLQQGFL